MRSLLVIITFLVSTVVSRNFRDLRTLEEEPFLVNSDLFNQALSLTPPESNEIDDLTVTTSRRFTGPNSFEIVTALPPGYSPMPPGFTTEKERNEELASENQLTESEPSPDLLLTKPREDIFHIAEIKSDRDDSSDDMEEEQRREERKFVNEITESSSELEILATTKKYEAEESSVIEGSGAFHDEGSHANLSSHEGSGRSGESTEEITFLVGLPKVKVSGEVGMESNSVEERIRKTISVDTVLWNNPSIGVEKLLGSQEGTNRTEVLRGVIPGCPTPDLCAKNCFVSLDDRGCQICQCLWQAVSCENDSDCPESQKCDLGKCDCVDGFVQDMTRSGVCKVADAEIVRDVLSLESLGVDKEEIKEMNAMKHKKMSRTKRHLRRAKRDNFGNKPRSAERLQWPGPCDAHSHCPRGLVCVRGDCWILPEKPLRRKRLRDSVPDSFMISSDDNWELESELKSRLSQSKKSRILNRFVGTSQAPVTRELLERTTMSPMDGHPNSLFEFKKTSVPLEKPQLAPSIVSEIYTSTHSWLLTSTAAALPEPDDLPPSPPPDNIGEKVGLLQWPETSPESLAKAFTKMIELPEEQVLKPKPRSERNESERKRKQATRTEATSTLDPIEFPISFQLESLKRDGISVEAPLALSATPTDEEIESHDQFMRALEEQRRRVQERNGFTTLETTTLSSFPTLRPEVSSQTSSLSQSLRGPVLLNGEQQPGVWYEMKTDGDTSERRRSPTSIAPSLTFQNPPVGRKRPIKVVGIVGGKLDNECLVDGQCGSRFRCCLKKWCDSSNFCSTARFCLPACDNTKTINQRVGLLDIVED